MSIYTQNTATIKTVTDRLQLPILPGDVGFNLPAQEQTVIPPGAFVEVHTGIRVELPEGFWAMVLPRSSTNRTGRLIVLPGVIDQGFRGEITILIHNIIRQPTFVQRLIRWSFFKRLDKSVLIREGQSVAQLVILPAIRPGIEKVYTLTPSIRGTNAFGSTDSKTLHKR